MTTSNDFRREYLLRLPLPLAQLYGRSYNAKSPRERHDNAFYLFEASAKLLAITSAAAYLEGVTRFGQPRVSSLDRMLAQLVLPSLGQWVGILRELSRHFAMLPDGATHPWGRVSHQLNTPRKELTAILALYRRIKNGPDGDTAGDQSCSILSLFDSLVQYRNGVFGHGAGRFESFFSTEMGPLLFPAVNELLDSQVLDPLGPHGAKLVYLAEIRLLDSGKTQIGVRELTGMQSERLAPIEVTAEQASGLLPSRVALLWPGRAVPLRLDPMLRFLETDLAEEVLFLNRDRNGRQIEYLSYTTGRTERDRSMLPELAQLMCQVTGNHVGEQDLKRLAEQTMSKAPAVEQLFANQPKVQQDAGDYEILAEIGRGGMGVVYLARQKSLGRLVALKTLPSELAADDLVLARFKREVRYLARCDDPHIVKVLANGTLPDGRVYYTMEYVPGSDLEMVWREVSGGSEASSTRHLGNTSWTKAVLSATRKQRSKSRPTMLSEGDSSPGDRPETGAVKTTWELPELPEIPDLPEDPGGYVRRVVALIQDVAVALRGLHDQGIVHRDIKPANLMLTPDGSRIVLMDFGLAKGETHALTSVHSGGLLGTLRYAAPEQLAAANITIGPAVDVRALGVTLWELLTRRRLFAAAADEARLAQDVLTCDVPRLRAIDPQFDRDLDALVARATERRLADRIPNAGKLAELLQLWLDGKPLPIRPPGVGEITLRWIREHRSLVAVSSAAALAVVAAMIASLISISAAKTRAEKAFEVAKKQGDLAMESLEALIYEVDEHLSSQSGMTETRSRILQEAMAGLEKIDVDLQTSQRLDQGRLEGLMRIGRVFVTIGDDGGLGGTRKAREQFQKMVDIAEACLLKSPNDPIARNYLAVALCELGNIEMFTGDTKSALRYLERSRPIAEALVNEAPLDSKLLKNLAVLCYRQTMAYMQDGNLKLAQQASQRDLEVTEKVAHIEPSELQHQNDLATSYRLQGDLYLRLGNRSQAIDSFRRDIAVSEKAHELKPDDEYAQFSLAFANNKLGNAILESGNPDEAERYFLISQTLLQGLYDREPTSQNRKFELGKSIGALADVALARGQAQEAKLNLLKKRQLMEEILAVSPEYTEVRSTLAYAQGGLAEWERAFGDLNLARERYLEATTTMQAVYDDDPENAEIAESLADLHRSLGAICMDLSLLDEARVSFLKSEKLDEDLVAANPLDASAKENLAYDRHWLGHAHLRGGNTEKAEFFFEASKNLLAELVAKDPKNAILLLEYAKSFGALGDLFFEKKEFDRALAALLENDRIVRDALAKEPNLELYRNLGWMQALIGRIWQEKGDRERQLQAFTASEESFVQVLKEIPKDRDALGGLANARRALGRVHYEKGSFEEAKMYFQMDREAMESLAHENPHDTSVQNGLGSSIAWQAQIAYSLSDFSTAERLYLDFKKIAEKNFQLEPANREYRQQYEFAFENLGVVYEKQQQYELALREFSARIELGNATAWDYSMRGKMRQKLDLLGDAREDFTKALELEPANQDYAKLLSELETEEGK